MTTKHLAQRSYVWWNVSLVRLHASTMHADFAWAVATQDCSLGTLYSYSHNKYLGTFPGLYSITYVPEVSLTWEELFTMNVEIKLVSNFIVRINA